LKAFDDKLEMLIMFPFGFGEDKDVIKIDNTEVIDKTL